MCSSTDCRWPIDRDRCHCRDQIEWIFCVYTQVNGRIADSVRMVLTSVSYRFGLKGPVFLVGRDGKTTVPLSLQSGNSEHGTCLFTSLHTRIETQIYYVDEEYLPNCDIQVDMPTAITVTAATLPKPIVFSLFDHVRVSLKLRKSHAHRHMVYMTLIDLQSSELPSKKMTSNEMMQSIITNNSVSTGQQPMPNTTTMSKQEIEARRELKKSTKHQGTMYELLEQFRKISITENTSN